VLGRLGGGQTLWHTEAGPVNCGHSHKLKDSLQMHAVWKGPLLSIIDFGHSTPVQRSTTSERLT
jgi:hypothetical protein